MTQDLKQKPPTKTEPTKGIREGVYGIAAAILVWAALFGIIRLLT